MRDNEDAVELSQRQWRRAIVRAVLFVVGLAIVFAIVAVFGGDA